MTRIYEIRADKYNADPKDHDATPPVEATP